MPEITELMKKRIRCAQTISLSLASLCLTSEKRLTPPLMRTLLPVRPVNCTHLSYWILVLVMDTCSQNKLVHFRDCVSCSSHWPFRYSGNTAELQRGFSWHYSAPSTIFVTWKLFQILASMNHSKDVHRYWGKCGELLCCLGIWWYVFQQVRPHKLEEGGRRRKRRENIRITVVFFFF